MSFKKADYQASECPLYKMGMCDDTYGRETCEANNPDYPNVCDYGLEVIENEYNENWDWEPDEEDEELNKNESNT